MASEVMKLTFAVLDASFNSGHYNSYYKTTVFVHKYRNMMEWFSWDWRLISTTNWLASVIWPVAKS